MATISVNNETWHGSSPTIYAVGSLDITRDNPASANVHVVGTIEYYGAYSGNYGTPNPVAGDGIGCYVSTNEDTVLGNFYKSLGSWSAGELIYSETFDNYIQFTYGTLEFYAHCGFLADDTCQHGYTDVLLGNSIDISEVPYNPYTAPSITLNSRKYKGEYNKTSDFWVKYTITPGSANIVRTVLEILDPNNNTAYQGYDNLSRTTGSEQTYYYTVSDSRLSGGGNYRIRLAVQDGTSTIYSNIENIFIYTKPSISIISNTDLGVYKKNNSYSVTYKITKGSENITNAVLQILNPSNNNVLASYNNLSKTTGSNQTYTYTLNSSNCRTWSLL